MGVDEVVRGRARTIEHGGQRQLDIASGQQADNTAPPSRRRPQRTRVLPGHATQYVLQGAEGQGLQALEMGLTQPPPGQETGAQFRRSRGRVAQPLQGVEGAAMAFCLQ